jgi:hypothetical protein
MKMLEVIRKAIVEFCQNFIAHPYLCYTEHGQHALFYSMLYNVIPEEQRYVTIKNQKVCIIQKEYPTAGSQDIFTIIQCHKWHDISRARKINSGLRLPKEHKHDMVTSF